MDLKEHKLRLIRHDHHVAWEGMSRLRNGCWLTDQEENIKNTGVEVTSGLEIHKLLSHDLQQGPASNEHFQ